MTERLPAAPTSGVMAQKPLPLKGDDDHNSFTYTSITERLPKIIDEMLNDGHFEPPIKQKIENLRDGIRSGQGKIEPIEGTEQDVALWRNFSEPFLGSTFLQVPWFFVEAYTYRKIMEITSYFEDPAKRDPFLKSKQKSLKSAMEPFRILCQQRIKNKDGFYTPNFDQFKAIIHSSLWGNKADLSLHPEGVGAEHMALQDAELILIEDTQKIWDDRSRWAGGNLAIIVDNCGFELVCDLSLIDWLLTTKLATQITMHVKKHPTFVSDATAIDVKQHIALLAIDDNAKVQEFGKKWQKFLEDGLLIVRDDFYWNSPNPFWDCPDHISDQLHSVPLVFMKGDANYRRVHGDLHWEHTASTKDIASYYPTSLVMLRTLKAEVMTGLTSLQLSRVEAEREWMVTGKYGIIQYIDKKE
eukprot:TRINITY_DN8115_c0_g1_i1.p1 TRINITY_DN8115_c0_g1~~TRINITY_DN8115_c0_g1_i1.p1  ORF type:complete len:420 (-),score=84.55 TRINITY_DN8115_c0_g1_i1:126-1364(-)